MAPKHDENVNKAIYQFQLSEQEIAKSLTQVI